MSFVCLPYIGGNLSRKIARNVEHGKTFTEPELLVLLRQIAQVCARIHDYWLRALLYAIMITCQVTNQHLWIMNILESVILKEFISKSLADN